MPESLSPDEPRFTTTGVVWLHKSMAIAVVTLEEVYAPPSDPPANGYGVVVGTHYAATYTALVGPDGVYLLSCTTANMLGPEAACALKDALNAAYATEVPPL